MALTAFTGTVSASTLNANFDDKTAAIAAANAAGQKDQTVTCIKQALAAGDLVANRSYAWTQQDDATVQILYAGGTVAGAGVTLTVTLTVDNSDTRFLVDNTCTATVTSSGAGYVDTRSGTQTDFRTVTGFRMRLLKGVRYRLTLSTSGGAGVTDAVGGVQLRSVRRTG